MNSPATKVPSHGTHAYGQTYAIDIVAEPAASGNSRPAFAKLWPVVRRSRAFPAYDEPLFAVADATVVHACDWMRDHLSRNSLPAIAYLMLSRGGQGDSAARAGSSATTSSSTSATGCTRCTPT